uniref:Strawberry notch helicase C domain-containing protein n=1 Tax=Chionoecetes opilio bacilliform virus TaxID=1825681 RepID=A0A1Q3DLU0_9VIRU|nr:hypothetical protein SCV_034 [Chionoecetes opilio bacilliform virus]
MFLEKADAVLLGTDSHHEPTFHLYESKNLRTVGLCDRVAHKSYPKYLPRPFNINTTQAQASTLALVNFYENKGWCYDLKLEELVQVETTRRSSLCKNFAGGFVIGDGTGVGKTRSIAVVVESIVLYEKTIQDATVRIGPSVFRCDGSSLDSVRQGSWHRHPFFIWLTCSRSLFQDCQEGIREVVENSHRQTESWAPFPDEPSYFTSGRNGSISFASFNFHTRKMDDNFIRFFVLQDIKDAVRECGGSMPNVIPCFTAAPAVLFMTYADLNANLEFVLKFITGGGEIASNVGQVDTFVTAILCDEFHRTKNITDTFRGELEKIWAEEDVRVLSNNPRPPNPSISKTVERFKHAMLYNDKQFAAKSIRSKRSFLSQLKQSDSFRLLLEIIKYDTFCLMVSATPFQSNADLHSVDHILRRTVPAYTSIYSIFGNTSTPDAIAENSEYSTMFLEQVVKLLRGEGQLVSRCISIENVVCSVVNCSSTPVQKYAIDELSSYCLNARQVLIDSKELGVAMNGAMEVMAATGDLTIKNVNNFIEYLNRLNRAGEITIPVDLDSGVSRALGRMDRRFTAMVIGDEETAHDGITTINSILHDAKEVSLLAAKNNRKAANMCAAGGGNVNRNDDDDDDDDEIWSKGLVSSTSQEQELLDTIREDEDDTSKLVEKPIMNKGSGVHQTFQQLECFEKLRKQYFINTASVSVATCKSALLSIKAQSVGSVIRSLRLSPTPQKAVMSLEQTGESYLSSLAGRVFKAPVVNSRKRKRVPDDLLKSKHGFVDLSIFDSSPLANTVLAGYRILCRAVAIATSVTVKTEDGGVLHVMLVPTPPAAEPLVALSGNSLDTIEQCVGETQHAEITNRKLSSRVTTRGLLVLYPNRKTSNTNQCIRSFNNTKEVDVMMLGPKGNTGLSLHDSKTNKVSAKRVHLLLDLPYNAVPFLQTIGRTHRNGQLSVPHFLVFTTDSPAERRFFDSLENRVKDSKAGTFADRYSNNSVSISSGVNREQFLDKGLVLRTVGVVIQIICSNITLIDLFNKFATMTLDIGSNDDGDEVPSRPANKLLAFAEGLNSSNDLFVDVLILGLHITLVVLGRQDYIRCPEQLGIALDFASVLEPCAIFDIAASAAKVIFSNLCLHLVYHREPQMAPSHRLDVLAEAANGILQIIGSYIKPERDKIGNNLHVRTLIAKDRDSNIDLYTDIISASSELNSAVNDYCGDIQDSTPLDKLVLQIIGNEKPNDLRALIAQTVSGVLTVRILGAGQKIGVISALGRSGLTANMIQLIPVVAASSVINILAIENPGLVLRIHNDASPHKQFREPCHNTSYVLWLARKLSAATLDFRQFQNNFFSPKKESELMLDVYSNVKSIMARDDRLDGLCETRMNNVMGASYVKVRKKPICMFRSKFLGENFRRHVARELDEEEGGDKDGKNDRDEEYDKDDKEGKNDRDEEYDKDDKEGKNDRDEEYDKDDKEGKNDRDEEYDKDDKEVKDDKEEQKVKDEKNKGDYNNNDYNPIVLQKHERSETHDLDVVLCNGIRDTLTKQNSVFVEQYVDLFVAANVIKNDGTILQLCFDNCDKFSGLPRFCLYETKKRLDGS